MQAHHGRNVCRMCTHRPPNRNGRREFSCRHTCTKARKQPVLDRDRGFCSRSGLDRRIFTLLTKEQDWQPSAPGRPMMTSGRAKLTSASFPCALGRRHSRADEVAAVTHGHVFLTPLRKVS